MVANRSHSRLAPPAGSSSEGDDEEAAQPTSGKKREAELTAVPC